MDNGNYIPYETVTDAMILKNLESNNFTDITFDHKIYNNLDHDAKIIATLANLIKNGLFDYAKKVAVHRLINDDLSSEYEIEDGLHRLRAFMFCKKHMPIIIYDHY
jgi:mannitol-specific phosphotransferase system IIBC component